MDTESNMKSTTELKEQVGASGEKNTNKIFLIFEKLIKENTSQEPVQMITKATHEQGHGQDPDDQEQLLHEGKCTHQTDVPETTSSVMDMV